MKSIKTKMVVSFSILILVSSLVLGLIALISSENTMTKEAEKTLSSMAYEDSKLTSSRLETQKRTLEMVALNRTIVIMNWLSQKASLQEFISETDFLDIAVVDLDGTAHYSDGTTGNLADEDYFKKALNGQSVISDVFINEVTNEPEFIIATPIYNTDRVVGELIGFRDGNVLSEIVEDTGYGKEGYGYIINSTGTVMAHPDKEKVLNQFSPIEEVNNDTNLLSLSNLFQKIIEEKKGISNYQDGEKKLYASYDVIEGTDWIFVITADQDEVLEALPALQRVIFLVAVVILIVSIIATYILGNSIAKPIIRTVGQAEKIANLDVSIDIDKKYASRKDEIGILSRSLQNITGSIRGIVGDISNSSEQLAAASEELTATSQQSASTSEEVSTSIEEIAKGAFDQAKYTEDGSMKANTLGEAIEKDQNHVKSLNEMIKKVVEALSNGLVQIEYLYEKTVQNNEASKNIQEVILKTNKSSNRIGEASQVISSIAEQTNLLSLNAAIEAARAGEAGKGFSVVAEEIRKLAEQSASSTKEIDEMVSDLQKNSQDAVKTIEEMSTIIEEQTESVHENKRSYLAIEEAIGAAETAVIQLNSSGEEMEKMKAEILDSLHNLSSIAEENSAATQQVTAAMEEQTASVEEIANSSEALASLAQDLQTIIAKFSL
ncbi:MAG TPA: methyl-accepting chemotaxis protein [Lachnospiraceae bacterium]|nr:methyl-accepting chemotaxis protein [Lachnospiraceae bacterium]